MAARQVAVVSPPAMLHIFKDRPKDVYMKSETSDSKD